jgi:hypothetical protein
MPSKVLAGTKPSSSHTDTEDFTNEAIHRNIHAVTPSRRDITNPDQC